jgi:glycerophosphoryl diester phosphodiesterase
MGIEPVIIAHRGACARAPENTLEAFRLAVEQDGAQGLELDVQRTRDGMVVVLHDETLERTTDGAGPVAQLDWSAARALDAGYRFQLQPQASSGEFPWRRRGVRIPALREVLEQFPAIWISIDLKRGDPRTERAVVALVRELSAHDRVVVGAEAHAAALRLRALAPELASFFSRHEAQRFYLRHRLRWWRGYRAPARSLQIPARFRGLDLGAIRLIADAHRLAVAVRYWTVNDEGEMARLLALGADGIITDDPARLRAVIGRMQRRAPPKVAGGTPPAASGRDSMAGLGPVTQQSPPADA